MQRPASLKLLKRELIRHGLPRGYVERVVRELEEHTVDASHDGPPSPHLETADRSGADLHLGDPVQLAQSFARAFRHQSFFGRHPVLTFIVAPIPLTLTLGALLFTVVGLASNLLQAWFGGGRIPCSAPMITAGFIGFQALVLLPPLTASWWLCRAASRAGLGRGWSLGACGFVAVLTGLTVVSCAPAQPPNTASISLGLGMQTVPIFFRDVRQFLQLLLPLAVAVWCLERAHRQRQTWIREWAG